MKSDGGIYAQDKWTIDRVTLSYGLRHDFFIVDYPEQHLGPGPLVPTRDLTLPETEGIQWRDLTPKFEQTTRNWTDTDSDFLPDCDLTNPAANGECAAMANPNFGRAVPGAPFDPDTLTGWGKRPYNWEFSAWGQHEILPRVSFDFGYFRDYERGRHPVAEPGAANTTVSILEPGTIYGERLNQLDVRLGKIFRYGRTRSTVSVDVYDGFNSTAVLTENSAFASWRRPTSILTARFMKVGMEIDF